jgi:ABC-type uncharacterized transport system permease subunit
MTVITNQITHATTNYKLTLMQRLLGRNYKWWYILKFKFNGRTVSTFDNMLFVCGHILTLLSILIIWWLANGKVIDNALQQKWTYFVIGEFFFNLIFNFAEYEGFDILRGKQVSDLLKPQSYFLLKLFDTYGESLLQNLIKGIVLATLLVIMIFTKNITYFNLGQFLIVILLLPIAWIVLYLIEIIVAFSAFFMNQVNGVILNFTFLLSFLMGRSFPLDLLQPNFYINYNLRTC